MRKDLLTRSARAPDWLADAVPGWLSELVKPRRAPVPWPNMIRAALAICLPLSVALAAGKGTLGVLPAMGGLLGTLADAGGPYWTRVERVTSASVLGGAVGLAIGSVIHGHGWLAVAGLVVMAGVSAVVSSLGDIGSITGLQLLVYTTLGIGPVGALRPAWHTAAGFLLGVAWALILIVPGWLLSPHGKEQRDVAAVFSALAAKLEAIGTNGFAAARQAVTGTLNTAYDELLATRLIASGRNRRTMHLIALLNAAHLVAEASTALGMTGQRVPPMITETVRRLAGSVGDGSAPPAIPPVWDSSPGALALRDAIAGAVRMLSGSWSPPEPEQQRRSRGQAKDLVDRLLDGFGRTNRMFTIRLMACVGVAGVVSEVLPLQRSYWVPLTVAIVFKPDYGSVFARTVQRGLGTVAGAVLGAVLLAAIHGLPLLIPFAVLAALLPYGRSRNYGLLATFLTPLVVILIDLLSPGGWRLAEDRLIDTLIGCAIVLAIGYAPWWTTWYAHLPRQFALAASQVADYIETAFGKPQSPGPDTTRLSERSRLRRRTYRALADLRAEFQRTMSEPPSISRRASAWWPAVVGLEHVMDAATTLALAISRGATAPPPAAVRALSSVLRETATAATTGAPTPSPGTLPPDELLAPVTETVKGLLSVLGNEAQPQPR
ncbi:MAG: FUSC family protein [Streptosporangiaceae bacterium]|nr:FUSC family protein [Streptosporangiaceae bacterium]